jgi:TorA maturation chaperone TorD
MDNNRNLAASKQAWLESLTGEALAFGFINRVFYERPAGEFIDTLIQEDLFAEWPLPDDNPFTREGLDTLRAFSAGWSAGQLETLNKDYQQLFIGPHRLPAPPWESVYLSVEQLVFEEQTLAVRQYYARYGLEVANKYKEPDDHFGLEMGFLAHLCTLGLEAIGQEDAEQLDQVLAAQTAFLQEHLLLWAPEFLRRVRQHARTDYYRGLALLAAGTVDDAAQRRGLTMTHPE